MGSKKITNIDIARLVILLGSKKKSNGEWVFTGVTKLQKIIFLLQEEEVYKEFKKKFISDQEPFKFKPNNFGPFSKDLEIVTKKLKKDGEIEIVKELVNELYVRQTNYHIDRKMIENVLAYKDDVWDSPEGKKMLSKLSSIASNPLSKLLKVTYQKHPEYTVNSIIADKVLSG
jgi:uncharacterized protein YwgA